MENLNIWKTIKIGFWLGIGFTIPQLIVLYAGTAATMFFMPFMMESSMDDFTESINYDVSTMTSKFDQSAQIIIKNYREVKNGNQLLILGEIYNSGDKKASSIQLEAELKDADGVFVYECSEYINNSLQPGENENFQIKCGCGKNPLPEHSTIDVRVVSASNY